MYTVLLVYLFCFLFCSPQARRLLALFSSTWLQYLNSFSLQRQNNCSFLIFCSLSCLFKHAVLITSLALHVLECVVGAHLGFEISVRDYLSSCHVSSRVSRGWCCVEWVVKVCTLLSVLGFARIRVLVGFSLRRLGMAFGDLLFWVCGKMYNLGFFVFNDTQQDISREALICSHSVVYLFEDLI